MITLPFAGDQRTSRSIDMMPNMPLWWILGITGALASRWVVRVFRDDINEEMFVKVVQKVIREKNAGRALKLAHAAGDIPMGKAMEAALLESASCEEEKNRPTGYRGSRPLAMETVRARIQKRWDDAFDTAADPLKNSFYLALPAPITFVGCIIFVLLLSEPEWSVIGVAAAGLLVWLYLGAKHRRILGAQSTAFESLWPAFESVYQDRHSAPLENRPVNPLPNTDAPQPANEAKSSQIGLEILEPGKPLRSMTMAKPVIKFGSLASNHVQLTADGVARMHAIIEMAEGKATIIDLGAERQTRVNLENVAKRELANGDVIGIGEAEIVVRLQSPNLQSS